MNNTINGILRAVIPAIVAYAVGKGWISQSVGAEVGAALITVAASVWSVTSKTGETK